MRVHMKIHAAENPEKLHSCDYCQNSFSNQYDLRKHMKTHKKKKPYSCSLCSKSFEYADQLKAHLICHTEEKGALRCPNCPMIFSKSSHLRSHLSTHSGVHMEIHTAEKPKKTYSCAYCKNFFTNKRAYFKHIKTHTEVNPYGCSQCPKSFEHADQLKVHFICHTGEEGAFRCPNCSKYIF